MKDCPTDWARDVAAATGAKMRIAEILGAKGAAVTTINKAAPMRDVIAILARERIGALPVSPDGSVVEGIVSERDVIRAMVDESADVHAMPVETLMTTPVHTCESSATLNDAMSLMIARKIRHIPVVDDGKLVGILSIGDLVNARLQEAESESAALAEYIANPAYN